MVLQIILAQLIHAQKYIIQNMKNL